MSIKLVSFAITATAVAAPLSATDLWVSTFHIQNIDSANEVFIGDSNVTAATGFQLLKTESRTFEATIAPTHVGDRQFNLKNVYVICSTAETATLRVAYVQLVS